MPDTPLTCTEFPIDVNGQSLACRLVEPDRLAHRPALLLTFAGARLAALEGDTFSVTPRMFLDAGHRAASFDLPFHGDRVEPDTPEGIAGICAAWMAGRDVFTGFVEEGQAAIDALIERGVAEPGRIFVAGTSRGAYCALRLMAADTRIAAAAAFCPVTDRRGLEEFAAIKDRPDMADLALTHVADNLAGRAVWIAIGNRDARVGTECCLRFVEAIAAVEAAQSCPESRIELHVMPHAGHALLGDWHRRGAEYLLGMAETSR